MSITSPFSFWLIPARPLAEQLAHTIQALCRQYDATPFAPHVTLFVGRRQADEDMLALGQKAADETPAFTLRLQKVDYSDFLFNTLFLQFAPHPSAAKMVQTIQASLHNPDDYQFDPHLSLIYKSMPTAVLQKLARSIQFDTDAFLFDRLSLVVPDPKTNDWLDTAGWRIRHTWTLGAGV
jgi:2'-5' RNA ligase